MFKPLRVPVAAAAALALAACFPDHTLTDPPGNGENGNGDRDRDPQAFLFDESVVRTYDLVVEAADWARLNDDPQAKEYVPATLHFEGEVVEQAAIRYKGNSTLFLCDFLGCPKFSIKLKFSEYDRDQRFHGLKRLNFHSMWLDPSQMRDAISYRLFRDNGVPAPRTAYANVTVNGELLGLFAVIEQVDGRMTRTRFPDGGQGNIYKEVWPIHDDPGVYRQALRSNRRDDAGDSIQHEADVSRMVRFTEALAEATDETFESVLESWTDIDALMNYNAVARAIDHWDDIIAFYCIPGEADCSNNDNFWNHNYYWYESTDEDRFWLVAWDLDNTFQEPSPRRTDDGMPDWYETDVACEPIRVLFSFARGLPPACDDFIRRMATVTWDRYVAATRAFLDGDFQVEKLHARIDALSELLEPHVAADPNGPGLTRWRNEVEELKAAVVAKVDHIEAVIAD